jgi:phytoene/squalene synthetase
VSGLPPRTREAYRQCESLTRAAAGNFYWGIRLLPPRKRRAMCAVYAFARRVDDIADGGLERDEKLRRLDAVAAALERLSTEDTDPVVAALADASARFRLPQESLHDLIAGVRMDVTGTSYADFPELEVYCRRVAGSVGRLCLAIFGTEAGRHAPSTEAGGHAPSTEAGRHSPPASIPRSASIPVSASRGIFARADAGSEDARAEAGGHASAGEHSAGGRGRSASELADDLGVALQLANIARDLREDAERGRVYLPARDLVRYHLHDDGPLDAPALQALTREASRAEPSVVAGFEGGDVGQLYALMRFQCLRSRDWFHRGIELVALLDRRSAACVLAMAGIYWRLLRHIEEHPDRALAQRARLQKREKAWVAARALVGKGIPERHPAERLQPEGS